MSFIWKHLVGVAMDAESAEHTRLMNHGLSMSFGEKLMAFLTKSWMLWIATFLMLFQFSNVLWQFFALKIGDPNFYDWDIHTMMLLQDESIRGLQSSGPQLFADRFTIYGPLAKFFIHPTLFFEGYSYGFRWGVIALYLGIMYAYVQQCRFKWSVYVILLFLCGFNFPFIFKSLFVLWLWLLAWPQGFGSRIAHGALAGLLCVFFLLFKPAVGVVAMMFIAMSYALTLEFVGQLCARLCWLGGMMLGILLLFLVSFYGLTERVDTAFLYLQHAMEDASSYAETMIFPLGRGGWWQRYFPCVLLFYGVALLVSGLKSKEWRVCLPLALLVYADYKHAYVRADYGNISHVFMTVPLYVFFWILKGQSRRVMMCSMVIIAVSFLTHVVQWSPSQTPWRHPRHFWIPSPKAFAQKEGQVVKHGKVMFDRYLERFEDVVNPNLPLLSMPGQIYLNRLSRQPLVLPSVQNYFSLPQQLKPSMDMSFFSWAGDIQVLWEKKMLDGRSMANSRALFYEKMFCEYELIRSFDQFCLLQKRKQPRKSKKTLIYQGSLSSLLLNRIVPSSSVLRVQVEDLIDWRYKLKKIMYKGDRLEFELSVNGKKSIKRAAYSMLEAGVLLCLDEDEIWSNREKNIDISLRCIGSQMDHSEADLGHHVYDTPWENLVKVEEINFSDDR